MKVCMIGSRGHFGYALESLDDLPRARVEGVSSGTSEDTAERLLAGCAARGRQPAVFDDYRTMLDRVKPDIAVVDGPFEQHAAMCVEAFDRGIHVFSEKPVATTMPDLERVAGAYERARAASGVQFAGMMGLRYDPAMYTAWQAVRGGAVGRVRLITAQKSYRLGERPAFYRRRATYGGTIPWVGSHALDWILWFSGERFLSVSARHSARDNRGHGELEVTALCQFTMTNEVLAAASMDYLRPAQAPTHGDDRVRVAGSDGVIEARGGDVLLIDGQGERKLPARCDRKVFLDFVEQVEGKGRSLITAEETIELTRVCLLALESADSGRPVNLTPGLRED